MPKGRTKSKAKKSKAEKEEKKIPKIINKKTNQAKQARTKKVKYTSFVIICFRKIKESKAVVEQMKYVDIIHVDPSKPVDYFNFSE
jgi:hypothetical protein